MVQHGKILAFQANDPGSNPGGRTIILRTPRHIKNLGYKMVKLDYDMALEDPAFPL